MLIRQLSFVLFLVSFAFFVDPSVAKKAHKLTKRPRKTAALAKRQKKKIIRLSPGDSIQDALDKAPSNVNVIIRLSPGDYVDGTNSVYGLRVSKDNVKLIGETDGENGVTRILQTGEQEVGVYAAPEGCEYKDNECDNVLSGFTIKGIVVEGFPKNGIQTRFVDGFRIISSKSINNLNNGLYPTLSMNGKIKDCVSTGSLDAGIWVAGSMQVKVLNNEVSESTTGIEVTVSKDVFVANNNIFDNVVGIGMYHANMAGTSPDFPPYDNWVFENNRISNNNRINDSPPGSFQSFLTNGVGILIVGVRGETVRNNIIEGNDAYGLGMVGFCTVQSLIFGVDCLNENAPIDGDPSAARNTIKDNQFIDNGKIGLPPFVSSGVDIVYLQSEDEFLVPRNENPEVDNCFEDNVTPDGEPASFSASNFESTGIPLPTGGCLSSQ
mmetsp:Transcript_15154/g.22141  ORF Transcript_15154/g.22141 Transcript_15154/m.22141 type:complete len:437 (-) Transcript_15154:238-1548(-)